MAKWTAVLVVLVGSAVLGFGGSGVLAAVAQLLFFISVVLLLVLLVLSLGPAARRSAAGRRPVLAWGEPLRLCEGE
jgi:uncharacterized membrane protein YtjA (UPF0391 family)